MKIYAETKATRQHEIINMLENRKNIGLSELAVELNVSVRTIQRDIQDLAIYYSITTDKRRKRKAPTV